MNSVTVPGFPEPVLLLDQAGGGLRSAGRNMVIGGAAKQFNRPEGVESPQVFPAQFLHYRTRFFPRLHPKTALGKLFRGPIRQAGSLPIHRPIIPYSLQMRMQPCRVTLKFHPIHIAKIAGNRIETLKLSASS